MDTMGQSTAERKLRSSKEDFLGVLGSNSWSRHLILLPLFLRLSVSLAEICLIEVGHKGYGGHNCARIFFMVTIVPLGPRPQPCGGSKGEKRV